MARIARMNSHLPKPTHDPNYHFIRAGSILREDDQFWDSFDRTWNPITPHSVGAVLDKESSGMFRRHNK